MFNNTKKFLVLGFISLLFLGVSQEYFVTTVADKPIIVCTTDVVGSIVREYLGDGADVVVLCHPSLCPADFDIKPNDIYAVRNAKILFKQGIPGEFWLQDLVDGAGNTNLTQVVIPGIYNTPEGAKNYITMVAGNLTNILGIDLHEKETKMLQEIEEVNDWMLEQANFFKVSSVKAISMSWLKTFVESVGFNVVAVYNPPETLSASDISELVNVAKNEEVALVIDNLQLDVDFGKGIAEQVGAEHVVLTNFPGALPNTESLAKMLRYNAEQLFLSTNSWRSSAAIKEQNKRLLNQLTVFQIATALLAVIAVVEAIIIYSRGR
jgi:ABC-type Zn uptake system ZnuABC Zn-binding protein ZnuA